MKKSCIYAFLSILTSFLLSCSSVFTPGSGKVTFSFNDNESREVISSSEFFKLATSYEVLITNTETQQVTSRNFSSKSTTITLDPGVYTARVNAFCDIILIADSEPEVFSVNSGEDSTVQVELHTFDKDKCPPSLTKVPSDKSFTFDFETQDPEIFELNSEICTFPGRTVYFVTVNSSTNDKDSVIASIPSYIERLSESAEILSEPFSMYTENQKEINFSARINATADKTRYSVNQQLEIRPLTENAFYGLIYLVYEKSLDDDYNQSLLNWGCTPMTKVSVEINKEPEQPDTPAEPETPDTPVEPEPETPETPDTPVIPEIPDSSSFITCTTWDSLKASVDDGNQSKSAGWLLLGPLSGGEDLTSSSVYLNPNDSAEQYIYAPNSVTIKRNNNAPILAAGSNGGVSVAGEGSSYITFDGNFFEDSEPLIELTGAGERGFVLCKFINTQGSSEQDNSAVLVNMGLATFIQCEFTNNTYGLYSKSEEVNLSDCVFADNTKEDIYSEGNLNLLQCSFAPKREFYNICLTGAASTLTLMNTESDVTVYLSDSANSLENITVIYTTDIHKNVTVTTADGRKYNFDYSIWSFVEVQ